MMTVNSVCIVLSVTNLSADGDFQPSGSDSDDEETIQQAEKDAGQNAVSFFTVYNTVALLVCCVHIISLQRTFMKISCDSLWDNGPLLQEATKAELEDLQRENEMSLEELLQTLPSEILEKPASVENSEEEDSLEVWFFS